MDHQHCIVSIQEGFCNKGIILDHDHRLFPDSVRFKCRRRGLKDPGAHLRELRAYTAMKSLTAC